MYCKRKKSATAHSGPDRSDLGSAGEPSAPLAGASTVTGTLAAALCGLFGLLVMDPGIVALPAADRGLDAAGRPLPPPPGARGRAWRVVPALGAGVGMTTSGGRGDGSGGGGGGGGALMYAKYCRTCGVLRPPRVAHCGACDVEVAGFDHHCGVTNTCIGEGNIRAFLAFVWGVAALCDFVLVYAPFAFFRAKEDFTAGAPKTFQAACIGLWIAAALSALHLNLGALYYLRLYVSLGVTLRDNRKRGGLFPGRDLAQRYAADGCGELVDCSYPAACLCCRCQPAAGEADGADDADDAARWVPRPFALGCGGNVQRLCCGPCCPARGRVSATLVA